MIKKTVFFILLAIHLVALLEAQDQVIVTNLKNHVYKLASDSLEGSGFGFTAKRMAVDYIAKQFESAGLKPVDGNYIKNFFHQADQVKIEGFNILGMAEGSDPVLKSEYILIGAHFDHMGYQIRDGKKVIFNGADDNASGVAAIIEIGRKLVSQGELLKRTVIIAAFDAEEIGLIGSGKFISEKMADPDRIRVMFSLDMVGNYEMNKGVEFNGLKSLVSGEEILDQVLSGSEIRVSKKEKTIEMRTDTWPFAKQGIPAIHVFTGETSTYHKPEDDSDLIDYEGMAGIVELMADFTMDLSGRETLAADPAVMKKSIDPFFQAGLSFGMGTGNFNYKEEFYNAKQMPVFEAGLLVQLRISKNFILQPGLAYSSIASKSEEGNIRLHSLSPRLNLLLTTPNKQKDKPFAYLLLGGYYSYHLGGTVSGKPADFTSVYSREEKGIQYGMGMQVYKFQIGFERRFGLSSVFRNHPDGNVFSTGRYFSFVYLF